MANHNNYILQKIIFKYSQLYDYGSQIDTCIDVGLWTLKYNTILFSFIGHETMGIYDDYEFIQNVFYYLVHYIIL